MLRLGLRALRGPVSGLPRAAFGRRASTVPGVEMGLGRVLQADLKTAMKAKDSFTATTIRSVLSEVFDAQKQSASAPLGIAQITTVIRKAQLRRIDAAKQFTKAARPDLAEKEQQEADLLSKYLPPKLSVDGIDKILRGIITEIAEKEVPKKAKGLCLKAFYKEVDKNSVDGDVVKQRIDYLWPSSSSSS